MKINTYRWNIVFKSECNYTDIQYLKMIWRKVCHTEVLEIGAYETPTETESEKPDMDIDF